MPIKLQSKSEHTWNTSKYMAAEYAGYLYNYACFTT